MPPTSKAVALSKFVPSAEELEQARQILSGATPKIGRSKTASMVAFVKAQGEAGADDSDEILATRGKDRQEYVARYLAFMSRKKGTVATTVSSEAHTSRSSAVVQYHRWSKHEMQQKIGFTKAKGWIESGKLPYEPDRITGDSSPECREYLVPITWTEGVQRQENMLQCKGENATTDEDIKNLHSLRTSGDPGTASPEDTGAAQGANTAKDPSDAKQNSGEQQNSGDGVQVKLEDPVAEKIKSFLQDPLPEKLKLQAMEVDCDRILPVAKKKAMLENFCIALEKHQDHLRKMLKAITRVVSGADVKKAGMPKLMHALDQLHKAHGNLIKFAESNGCGTAASHGRGSRKRVKP